MNALPRRIAPPLHPKHFNRINPCLARGFRTSASLRALDLAFDYHENGGKANGAPIVFLHGLFGSKKNNRSMSKVLARDLNRPVYAVDLRNHGDSPHDKNHKYTALAEDVEGFLTQHNLRDATLIGHSMGAKTVMTVALRNPDACANIIAVDNAPVDAALTSDFPKFVMGMQKVEEAKVKTQKEADAILEPYAPDAPVRLFLLTNLIKSKDPSVNHLIFRIPIRILAHSLDDMADFPFTDPEKHQFKKPTLFVRGTKSHYVSDETLPIIGRFFPRFQLVDVEAGHWVISENPEAFRQAVVEFLQDTD